jgi:hypothetical protein
MRDVLRRYAGPGVVGLLGIGQSLSGFRSPIIGVVLIVLAALWAAWYLLESRRESAPTPVALSMGPSPFPRSKLEGAVVRSLIAFQKVGRERSVQGDAELFDRLVDCAGETDLRLEEAHAGELHAKFRQDGLHPPHNVNEQVGYLDRQIKFFENALFELRRDEARL